jgi:TolA-binding protein
MKNLKFLISIGIFIFLSLFLQVCARAGLDKNQSGIFLKQILAAKNNPELFAGFNAAKEGYFKDDLYNDFAVFLKSLPQKKKDLAPFVDYYTALNRYQQLKSLEEKQGWDEYFSQGNSYRDEITGSLDKAIKSFGAKEPLGIYSRLLLWQFHQDQQDAFAEQALNDLRDAVLAYAQDTEDLVPIKETADRLLSYNQKGPARQFYKIYIDKITASEISEKELSNMAKRFLEEGNLELAETVYDACMERIKSMPQGKDVWFLSEIAKQFIYNDEGIKDVFYAEKIFLKIDELLDKGSFLNEDLMYLRGFNLEKTKEYAKARDAYIGLLKHYPASTQVDELNFKIGIISVYVSRDLKSAKEYFGKLAEKENLSPQVISALYQLGLLSQWEENFTQAKEYYSELIQKARSDFSETVNMAQDRLKEIGESKPLDYNLKTFLDMSLKEEYVNLNMSKVDLKSSAYRPEAGKEITITATASPEQSGCMQVALEYLWSGDLGNVKPSSQGASLITSYAEPGTKLISLIVTTSSGMLDKAVDLIDVK